MTTGLATSSPVSTEAVDRRVRRATAAAGVAGTVLLVAALALIADAPGVDAAPETVAGYATTHGTTDLVSVVLAAAGSVLSALFAVGLAGILGTEGTAPRRDPTPAVGAVGIAIAMTVVLVGLLAGALAGFGHAAADPALVRTLNDAVWVAAALSGIPTALGAGAFAVAMRGRHRWRWSSRLAVVVVLAHLAVATALADAGPWTPSGVAGQLAPLVFSVWVLVTSVALVRTPTGAGARST